jgi:general secretion pathway protein A
MYKEYFGFRELPFSIAPDPGFLYMSEKHREALAHLTFGIATDGAFILLTGEVGTGKTTVCRCMLDQMPADCDTAFILNPKLTEQELLATICEELSIDLAPDGSSIKGYIDRISRRLLESHSAGRKTVLIIDEAQNLSTAVLEQLRLLTNLETNECKLLQIILIGQPELRDMLAKPELRQLSQRITARFHLTPLSKNEIADYIGHRLSVAGGRKRLFHPSLMGRIYRLSMGIPRLINLICDRALLGAYAHSRLRVDKKMLAKAAEEVLGKRRGTRMWAWLWK